MKPRWTHQRLDDNNNNDDINDGDNNDDDGDNNDNNNNDNNNPTFLSSILQTIVLFHLSSLSVCPSRLRFGCFVAKGHSCWSLVLQESYYTF